MTDRPETPRATHPEESLDPADWTALRALAHRMVDEAMTYLETVRERPVWTPVPQDVEAWLEAQDVPWEPTPLDRVYADFVRYVLPHPLGNIHPRFWGWVNGTGTPTGALAEMLAATMNPNVGGRDHFAPQLELRVVDWLKELMGFPDESTGLFVSGCSVANVLGLTVARDTRAEVDVTKLGLAAAPRRMTLYASREVHNSIPKAAGVLGLGRDALRLLPVDAAYRVDVRAVREAVRADRAAGLLPFCVVGNAGTVNTGAIDDLDALADLCRDEGLWFHVDGAFGAWAAIAPSLRERVRGMERADSLAFDLHKWMYVPYEAAVVLVRHPERHKASFATPAPYLMPVTGGLSGPSTWLSDYGVQLSRGFRALKVWMSLREHGVHKYARLIEQNVAQAQALAARVAREPELELLAPAGLNIVCFRYRGGGGGAPRIDDPIALNALNQQLLVDVQVSGVAVPSSTVLEGRFALRCAVVNHRSRREDFDLLVDAVLTEGRRLAGAADRSPSR